MGRGRRGKSVTERQCHGGCGAAGVYQLHVAHARLFVDVGTGVHQPAGIVLQVGVQDEFAVDVAAHVQSLLQYAYGVLATRDEGSLLVGDGGLGSVLALLDGVAGVAPSAQVQPGIVVGILIVEDDEESLGSAVLRTLDGHVHVGRRELAVQQARHVGCRGVGLPEGVALQCPLAVARRPVGWVEVGGRESRVGGRHPQVGECGAGGPGAYAHGALRRVQGWVVARLGPEYVLLADVVAEHALYVVRRCAVAGVRVEAYHVGAPDVVLLVGEDGGIAHHGHGLAVLLAAEHEDGLAQSGIHVAPPSAVLRHGVFAHVDVGRGDGVVVVAPVLADEEVGGVVVVLVLQFYGFGDVVEVVAVGDEVQVGPARLDGPVELHVALHVVVAVEHEFLFVADFQILEVEGFGVSVCGAHASVECRLGIASRVLYGIQRLLHEGFNLVLVGLPFVPYAHVHDKHGVGPQVLGQLQQFVVAQSVGHLVSPVAVQVAGAFLDGAHRLLPLEAVGGSVAVESLDVASAGEAHEAWVQVGQHLGQVGAASVGAVLIGWGEETHHIQAERTRSRALQGQQPAPVGRRGRDGGRQSLPLACGIHFD